MPVQIGTDVQILRIATVSFGMIKLFFKTRSMQLAVGAAVGSHAAQHCQAASLLQRLFTGNKGLF